MHSRKINLFIVLSIILMQFSIYSKAVHLENTKNDSTNSFSIKFIRSISNQKDVEGERSLGGKIIDWILGEDNKWLIRPMAMCVSEGIIYALDQGGGYLVRIDTLEEEFDLLFNENDELFPSLLSITVNRMGNLLFSDSRDNCVYLFNTENKTFKNFSSNYKLKQPTGIAFNKKTNEIWIVETKKHSITVFNEKGEYQRSIGKRGTNAGEFNFPTYIWIDDNGLVYIVDSSNFRIQIMNSVGEVQTIFGEVGDASGYFARPKGIALDSYGHIFIVDGLYNTVQVFDYNGNFLYYFGGKGSGDGELWLPTGIFIDEDNYIYIADSYNSRIQIFRLIENEKN